jgi:hypothetical protein
MDERELHRYLQDHASGSDVALAIATRLARAHTGTEIGSVMDTLAENIRSEQRVVRSAIDRLPFHPDPIRRAFGLVGAAGRLAGSLPFVPEPSLVEDLEGLAVGIWGKRLLWGALARVAASEGGFDGVDLDELAAKAEDQEREILRLRSDALEEVFDLVGHSS